MIEVEFAAESQYIDYWHTYTNRNKYKYVMS